MGHAPAETSLKSLYHYGQNIKSGNFQLFDFGSAEANRVKYNSAEPPIVDMKDIYKAEVPIAMFAGSTDEMDDITDVQWTRDQILDDGYGSDIMIHY